MKEPLIFIMTLIVALLAVLLIHDRNVNESRLECIKAGKPMTECYILFKE